MCSAPSSGLVRDKALINGDVKRRIVWDEDAASTKGLGSARPSPALLEMHGWPDGAGRGKAGHSAYYGGISAFRAIAWLPSTELCHGVSALRRPNQLRSSNAPRHPIQPPSNYLQQPRSSGHRQTGLCGTHPPRALRAKPGPRASPGRAAAGQPPRRHCGEGMQKGVSPPG